MRWYAHSTHVVAAAAAGMAVAKVYMPHYASNQIESSPNQKNTWTWPWYLALFQRVACYLTLTTRLPLSLSLSTLTPSHCGCNDSDL